MSANETIRLSRQVHAEFREYRNRRFVNTTVAFYGAQIAILNIIQAFSGLVPDKKIIQAVRNAKSPNAVSRALRSRLSFR